MATSKLGVATRAFVVVLLALARSYDLALSVDRDSSEDRLLKAYRKVLLKVHPDKGGNKADVQKLQPAKEAWDSARKGASKAGRPGQRAQQEERQGTCLVQKLRAQYRLQSTVVLLTYQGVENLEQWHRFVAFVQRCLKKWAVCRWFCPRALASQQEDKPRRVVEGSARRQAHRCFTVVEPEEEVRAVDHLV